MRTKSIPLTFLMAVMSFSIAARAQTYPTQPPAPTPMAQPPAPTSGPPVAAPPVVNPAPAPAVPAPMGMGSSFATPAPAAVAAPGPAPLAPPSEPSKLSGAGYPSTGGESDEPKKGFLPALSLAGPIGLFRVSTSDIGEPLKLRLGVHGEYFSTSGFLVEGASATQGSDRNRRIQGALTFSATATDSLEIFGAVLGSANRNRRLCYTDGTGQEVCAREAGWSDPEVIKSFGDLILGAKLGLPIADGFSAGGEFGLRFLSSVDGISFSGDSTSFWLTGIGGYDLRAAVSTLPLRLHLNLGYYVDKSSNLQDYDALNTSAFSRYVSSFAYGISHSRFQLAFGVDAPLAELAEGFSLRPVAELHFEFLNGDKDRVIYDQERQNCGIPGAGACKDSTTQSWLTLGIQGQVGSSMTLSLGLDLGLQSVGFAYGPPLPPWNLIFGASYALDLVPRVITQKVFVEKPATAGTSHAHEGTVAGKILSNTGAPLEGAIVGIAGRPHSRVLTEADGTFQSVFLPPGPVDLVASASGYDTAVVRTEVVGGQTANVSLRLIPKPPAARITGRMVDETGKGIVGSLKVAGPQIMEGKSDDTGAFALPVIPGQYMVRVDADQYLSKEIQVTATEGKDSVLSVTLRTRPAVAGALFQDGKIVLRQAVTFKMEGKKPSAELSSGMPHLLDEVVDILANHPEIRQVRVEAHWDSGMAATKSQTLTDQQAEAIMKYMIEQGVAPERLKAQGMGGKKPLVPNLGAGKLKNRRVEFVVAN